MSASFFHSDFFSASPRRAAWGVAVFVVGVGVSFGAFWLVRQAEEARTQAEFEQRARAAAYRTVDGLKRHQDTLFALRNLFHFSAGVDRAEFSGAAKELTGRYVGIRALEWVQRVPGEHREAFEASVRAEGYPDFEIRERVSGNLLRRMRARPEYFPVVFIEPMAGNEPALGFDLQSGITWPTMEEIARTGALAASGRLPLLTSNAGAAGTEWGYLMELPVYHRPLDPATPEERQSRLRGYVLGIFHIEQTLESFFNNPADDDAFLEVLFLDRSAAGERQFLHFHGKRPWSAASAPVPTDEEMARGMHLRVPIDHAGRKWELWFHPEKAWLASRSQMRSWLTLALGLVVTGSAASFVFGALRREWLVGRLVAERTAELRSTQVALEHDIRERQETERQLSSVISQLPGAAFRCRFDDRFSALFASDGMFQLTGYAAEEFVSGRVSVVDLTLPEDRPRAREAIGAAIAQRGGFEFEYRIRDRDGKVRWLLVRGRPVFAEEGTLRFIEGLAIDVSALKAAEQEKLTVERRLLEAQKLESLGVLAGGIAHDFNNLLTAMLGNATLAKQTVPATSVIGEHLQQIEQAARRAADLCQQMLAYAGRKEIRAQRIDLSEIVRSTAALLRVSIHKNTRLTLQLDDALPAVMADRAQLQQILMNLVINAADAIGEATGEITIVTFQRFATAEFLRTALHQPELAEGNYVGFEVRDNGSGMSPETMARIFEPFFTTKFSGRGLGLASVLGIVQRHRGAMFVESELGRGSTFRLWLKAEAERAPQSESPAIRPVQQLAGTALVVDDEDSVRDIIGRVLRRHGMKPILAASGEEALQLFADHNDHFDLVLLDLTMPGLSGEQTLRALRERNATQRVMVMSGYSEHDTMTRCAQLGVTDFIAKPFEVDVLLRKLNGGGST